MPYNAQLARDSLELASLASSSQLGDASSGDGDGGDGGGGGAGKAGSDGGSDGSSRPSFSSSRKASLEHDDPLDFDNPAASGLGLGLGHGHGHGRTMSVSSGFDLAANLFPLSSTAGADGYAPLGASAASTATRGTASAGLGGSLERHKTLSYINGLSLVIGLVIGSGIFSSPSQVNTNVGSPGGALVVWVVAGVLAWTGASSYAELGGAIPLNGGSQAYLAKILGEVWGFLFTWVAVLVLKPGSAAIVALVMGEYLVRAFVGVDDTDAGAGADDLSPWVTKTAALAGVVVVTVMNCVSTKLGTRVNDLLMVLKFVALVGVAVVGIVVAATGHAYNGRPSTDWKTRPWFAGTSTDASAWAVALYAGLWAFDGWDNTNYVVGEFRHPRRDLPRVLHTAMPLVIACYVLANIAYFLVLSLAEINATNTVAVVFGARVFGPAGALVFALVVSASCFGALNSSTFTSSRLVYVAGREGYLPAVFGQIGLGRPRPSPTTTSRGCVGRLAARLVARLVADDDTGLFYTPIYALALNCALTGAYVLVGEFSTLLTFYGVAGYTFYFLTVLGLIVLRVREPALERPYKAWITTPIVFCCVSLFLLSRAVFAQPLETLVVVAFILAGLPVYYWRVRRPGPAPSTPSTRWWRFWA